MGSLEQHDPDVGRRIVQPPAGICRNHGCHSRRSNPHGTCKNSESSRSLQTQHVCTAGRVGTEPDWGWHSGIERWEGQSHGDRKQDSPTSAQRSNENRPSQHSCSHENPKRCLNLSWLDSQVIAVISLSASNSCIRGQATSFLTIFAHKTQVSLWTRSLSIFQSVILIPTMLIPATIHVQSVNLTGVCYLLSILK